MESGACEREFREVFGTSLKRSAGRADTFAQFLRDDLPPCAGGSEGGYLTRGDGDWRIAGAIGVLGSILYAAIIELRPTSVEPLDSAGRRPLLLLSRD